MIEAHELTKRYGDTIAVHSLSFTIAPGTVTVNGKPYRQHRSPLREVGGLLEASAVHPGRSARSHLREGVQWVRQLVRALAAEGRTVLLSWHLMSEMSQTADHLLVIGRGHIIAAGPVQQVIDSVAGGAVQVRSPRAGELAAALAADGATVTSPEAGMLDVSGTTAALPDSLTQCSHTGWDATAATPASASSAISTSRSTHDS